VFAGIALPQEICLLDAVRDKVAEARIVSASNVSVTSLARVALRSRQENQLFGRRATAGDLSSFVRLLRSVEPSNLLPMPNKL
jgi:hypothetical protein